MNRHGLLRLTAGRRGAALGMACALSAASAAGAEALAVSGGPLHIVHEIRDRVKLEGQSRNLQVNCRQVRYKEDALTAERNMQPLPAAPDATYWRIESFFDGEREARYSTSQIVRVDADCKPQLLRNYAVDIHDGCTQSVRGAGGVVDGDGRVKPPDALEITGPIEPGGSPTCPSRKPVNNERLLKAASEVPVETLNGYRCIWLQDVLQRLLGAPVKAKTLDQRGLADLCLWSSQPWYLANRGRPVVISMGTAHTARPRDIRTEEAALAGLDGVSPMSTPIRVEHGAKIDPRHFSATEAEAFIRQPVLVTPTAATLEMR